MLKPRGLKAARFLFWPNLFASKLQDSIVFEHDSNVTVRLVERRRTDT
jgi:hypothetical protein